MRVVGFSIVRNAVVYDYPIVESIRSALPLVDEMVVAVGKSSDETRQLVESVGSSKIRIIDTVWDDSLRRGGTILSQQTNLAMDACQGDWLLYLQADEVLHERDYEVVRQKMHTYLHEPRVEGLSFRYHHFRADYTIRDPLPYRKQVRIVRPGIGIRSYGDACGFRMGDRKLQTAQAKAWVYHYGYVRPPRHMAAKMDYFTSLYDGRNVVPGTDKLARDYAWNLETCEHFGGSHPRVMAARIRNKSWKTPEVALTSRWQNPKYWGGLVFKNSRTIRRWAGHVSTWAGKAAFF